MHLKRALSISVVAFVCSGPGHVAANIDAGDGLPPIVVPGVRVVDLRNSSGGLSRYTTIPSGSAFSTTGGSGAPCQFFSPSGGTTSSGETYAPQQIVQSYQWIFVEGLVVAMGEPNETDPNDNAGPLSQAVRHFVVFCDSVNHSIGAITVSASDPMLNPRPQIANLYNGLQLEQPIVYTNEVVDIWGGLITRFPAWLAIQPSAWRPQKSSAATWRGWTMYLLTNPLSLEFLVDFTPDPEKPSPPFHGVVPCVGAGSTTTADADAFPALPELPEQTTPGMNGQCMWTPPGPGSVTIQARITYSVTFWANAYTEAQPDYVWTSPVATFDTGELAAVNTNG